MVGYPTLRYCVSCWGWLLACVLGVLVLDNCPEHLS
jgi:hypothetical protein